jgi:hypothetical protein
MASWAGKASQYLAGWYSVKITNLLEWGAEAGSFKKKKGIWKEVQQCEQDRTD